MRALAQCLSHSPLLRPEALQDARGPAVAAAIEDARRALADFAPEVVVLFGPDHYHGFFNELMPAFCIGVHANGAGDWGTSTAALSVDSERACALQEYLLTAGFDPAVSHDMRVDHGFAQPLASISPPASAVIPIFLNCTAPPLLSMRRAHALGEAIGSFFRDKGIRVAFIGSGGLSHDVGFPDVRTASGADRERVLRRREEKPEERAAAEARIQTFVTRFVAGETPLKPLNEEWDRQILRQFEQGDFAAVEALSDADITRLGGAAGHEIRTWVAALSAVRAYGKYRVEQNFYACVPEWIVGFGALRAVA